MTGNRHVDENFPMEQAMKAGVSVKHSRGRAVILIAALVMAALAVVPAVADRGSIPFKPYVHVYEPNQRAVIAWNGREEILLLSTNLRASEPSEVLEVIPLPAEPEVTQGDINVFSRIDRLLRSRGPRGPVKGNTRSQGAPAGEITFHERIGQHDVSVAHVRDRDEFAEWVTRRLTELGVDAPALPPVLKESIAGYIHDGFRWFVFDVVSLTPEARSVDALQYRFATKRLFYPLRISRTDQGSTAIDLFVLTPRLLRRFPGLAANRISLSFEPVSLNRAALASLDGQLADFFGRSETVMLRSWHIEGDLGSFDRDLWAH